MYKAINVKMENYEGIPKGAKRGIERKLEVRKFLADVPQKYVFRCHDGRMIRNMKELSEAFLLMTDETYVYHRNTKKKDFSNWVRDIIGDTKLARNLELATSQSLAAWEVATRIAYLTKR